MVPFFSTTLAISIVGLSGLLFIKRYEMKRGTVVLGKMRPVVDRFFHVFLHFIEGFLPSLLVRSVRYIMHSVRTGTHRAVAWVVLHVEHLLEKLLHTVRERTQAPLGGGRVSSFLQEVADHKRTLAKRSKSDRVILDE